MNRIDQGNITQVQKKQIKPQGEESSAGGIMVLAVFFHRINRDHLEPDHLCLERKVSPVLPPKTNIAALPLAA